VGTSDERFRRKLVEAEVMREEGDEVVFPKDHLFSSPSARIALLALWTGAALLYAPFSSRLPTDADAFLEGHPAFPEGAADYLVAQRFRGRLMTPFVEGGYAMWRLHPRAS
jgi:hypothetical protein